MAQAKVNNVFAEITSRVQLKETTKGRVAHTSNIGQLREADIFAVMGIDKGFHLMYTTAVTGHLNLRKARG